MMKAEEVFTLGPGLTAPRRLLGQSLDTEKTPFHWKMKYRQANGKESPLSFGAYPAVSLEQAGRKLDEARSQKASGRDPGEVKRQEKAEMQSLATNSFRAMANAWVELTAANVKPQTMKYYKGVLNHYLIPALGDTHIKDIKPSALVEIMRNIENKL
jgi:hypothetical protein